MRSSSDKLQRQRVLELVVNQKPIRCDMTLMQPGKLTLENVISVFWREPFTHRQHADNGLKLFNLQAAANRQLVIALERRRPLNRVNRHFARSLHIRFKSV